MTAARFYRPDERPDVEVLVDGTWCPGELRAWLQRDEEWVADVQYRPAGEHSSFLGTLAAEDVREDTLDRLPSDQRGLA